MRGVGLVMAAAMAALSCTAAAGPLSDWRAPQIDQRGDCEELSPSENNQPVAPHSCGGLGRLVASGRTVQW